MDLKINNSYVSHLLSLKTDNEKQRFLKKLNNDADKENENAIVARCLLKLEGYMVEKSITDSLKNLDNLVKEKRSPLAANALGLIYKKGLYEQRESAHKADDYLRIAAQNNDPSSCYELGKMYLNGDGVRKDIHESLRWIEKAAEKGNVEAMVMYGELLLGGGTGAFGDAVKPNPQKAITVLNKANEKGSERAREVLCKYYAGLALSFGSKVTSLSEDTEIICGALTEIEWVLK
ncbi:tetratricopeptide repeat protein [Vibrio sp. D431a]|uniref:tetratricopeptide repeat protein n=1 Tax=Vibrio sp. D431a TaxID=2837388 RepID=UPI002556002B|nr:tetratricopeptide repeat protein [Vibrio sp. D431a]MDK9793848.1 sel1 repeat family protein [Vibrio sp. D431a]